MKKTLTAIALLVTAGLALTACGDDSGSDGKGSAASTSSPDALSDADYTFVQQMIPHHEQAMEMAKLAQGRTSNPEVLDLAKKIEAAQGPEIKTLEGWLDDMPDDMGGMDHGDMGDGSGGAMSGMMDADEMKDLMGASGANWDRMFLTMMIEHHEGAIDMAQVQVDAGKNPDTVAMANKIISDQKAEITRMQQLLKP